MIRVVMLGRLGNNLFQYAMGRVLAEKHGVPLVMDASWFKREGWMQVECLRNLPGLKQGKAKVVRRFSIGARALLKITGKHYWDYRGVPILRENEANQSYDPTFLDAPSECFLFGYFQTPLYFSGHEEAIRRDLSTKDLPLEIGRESLARQMREPASVAVHVRRTDYVGNPGLDICGTGYYRASMDQLRDSLTNPRFHLFSDDPRWCSENLTAQDVDIVPYFPAQSPLVDLHLMSLANHHIIANSSYSWWAAWLGKKVGQQVLMPSSWFGRIHAPIEEKRCDGWQIVSAPSKS